MDANTKYTLYAQMYVAMRAKGSSRAESYEVLMAGGYDRSLATLDQHVMQLKSTGHALTPVKRSGAESALSNLQKENLASWVQTQNSQNEVIGLGDVQRYIRVSFEKEVCLATCCNYLKELDLTRKACQWKSSGFLLLNDELQVMYWNFIRNLRASYKLCIHPSKIASIDATTTKAPVGRTMTYSRRGTGKQKAKFKRCLYTNAIVSMIWADGMNHTPCILYTHDPRMAPKQKNTARGSTIRAAFVAALEEYGITEDRINYSPSKKHYTAESAEVYEHFLRSYDLPDDVLILHDGGTAFKRQSKSVFEAMGYKNHVTYPSEVHQYLSPNDNNLHGCKSVWRREYSKFPDDVSASLRLMQLIDQDTIDNSQYYFERNILYVRRSDLGFIVGN